MILGVSLSEVIARERSDGGDLNADRFVLAFLCFLKEASTALDFNKKINEIQAPSVRLAMTGVKYE